MHESPINPLHRKRGARMTNEHGWNMPEGFSNPEEEYTACRKGCGIFDLSHLGKFRVEGDGVMVWAEGVLSNTVDNCADGGGQTTFLLRENGSVIDRLLLFRESARSLYLVGHAARADSTFARLSYYAAGTPLQLQDMTHRRCGMALCGPRSEEIVQRLLPEAKLPENPGLKRCRQGCDEVVITRSGTGTAGCELWVAAASGIRFFESCVRLGAVPCGTATREALRLEAGIADAERDLRQGHTPLQSGLARYCAADKEYPGAARLRAGRMTEPLLRLAAMDCAPICRIPAMGDAVTDEAGHAVGSITSGSAGVTAPQHRALAYLLSRLCRPGTRLYVLIQGRSVPAVVSGRDIC